MTTIQVYHQRHHRHQEGEHNIKRRIIYAMAYDVLKTVDTLQREQDTFLRKTEGKRYSWIIKNYDGEQDTRKKRLIILAHRYHVKKSIGSVTNITERLTGRAYQTVLNSIKYLKHLGMISYSRDRRSYLITQKGLEYISVYDDLTRLFPLPNYDYYNSKYNTNNRTNKDIINNSSSS